MIDDCGAYDIKAQGIQAIRKGLQRTLCKPTQRVYSCIDGSVWAVTATSLLFIQLCISSMATPCHWLCHNIVQRYTLVICGILYCGAYIFNRFLVICLYQVCVVHFLGNLCNTFLLGILCSPFCLLQICVLMEQFLCITNDVIKALYTFCRDFYI